MRSVLVAIFVVSCIAPTCLAEKGLRFTLDGEQQTILPLGYTSRTIKGLKRDGYMIEVRPNEIKDPTVIPRFKPFSQAEARGELLREFGKQFEVTGTGNYLVVHPRGAKDIWAKHFEELYRSMTHFFRTRGYPMKKPKFPLVGIVFHSQEQYLNYCRRELNEDVSNTYGVYIFDTNRIYLFDVTRGGGTKSKAWDTNLNVVMHEVAHQTAFNTNIHVRGGTTPAWVAEGIGCLFEAKGIHNSFQYKAKQDKLNNVRLQDFQSRVVEDADTLFASIVASDKLFQRDPTRAYAAAWALTFYLSERQPRKYIDYLKTVAKIEPCEGYSKSDRVRDFTQAFGKDFRMLATRTTRFVERIPRHAGSGR